MVRVGSFLGGVAVSCLLALAGCDDGSRQLVEVCEKGCDCQSGLPAQRDACFDSCMAELGDLPPGFTLPEDCRQCVQTASCVTLAPCFDLCGGEDPEEEDF